MVLLTVLAAYRGREIVQILDGQRIVQAIELIHALDRLFGVVSLGRKGAAGCEPNQEEGDRDYRPDFAALLQPVSNRMRLHGTATRADCLEY
jgi:hypothetical protein